MACGPYIWYTPLGQIGQDMADLSQCRQYILAIHDYQTWRDGLTIYFSRSEGGRWIRVDATNQYAEDSDYGLVEAQFVMECHPQEVAHEFLTRRVYGDRLPPELEEYRPFGEATRYESWRRENPRECGNRPTQGRPDWRDRAVTIGGKVCKRFERKAPSQFLILDALQESGWRFLTKNPIQTQDALLTTIKEMNRWDGSPLRFMEYQGGVKWKIDANFQKKANSS